MKRRLPHRFAPVSVLTFTARKPFVPAVAVALAG